MIMAELIYRNLEGMTLDFVSGRLDENPKERSIRYTASFDLGLDFTHFVQMANVYSPGYLDNPVNAIRPELDGLAYHYSYNYLFDAAGNIRDNQALIGLFTSPRYYMDQWATGPDLEVRFGKPTFESSGRTLRITACKDFRSLQDDHLIQLDELPVIQFHWALNLLEGHLAGPEIRAPESKVVFMYMNEGFVEVEGEQLLRGTQYLSGEQLKFGEILPKQILVAK
jgi:hypothetical protein